MKATPQIDVHQHLWSPPLLAALEQRREPPFVRRHGQDWIVSVPGEPDSLLKQSACGIEQQVASLANDGVDFAVISLSSALGIEALHPREAEPLLEAYRAGIAALPSRFLAWGAVGLHTVDRDSIDTVVAQGFIGLSLPAGAVATPVGLERCAPLLERLEELNAPLFIHPGPSPWDLPRLDTESLPTWWPALTDYIAGMSAAWHTFTVLGREKYPDLKVLFAMLAGCAPIHIERLASRGIEGSALHSPNTFYDSSSYGPKAIRAVAGHVGTGQIVYGSDRPVVSPTNNDANRARLTRNGARLIDPQVAAKL